MSEPLELDLQVVSSHLRWVLGTERYESIKHIAMLDHLISPAMRSQQASHHHLNFLYSLLLFSSRLKPALTKEINVNVRWLSATFRGTADFSLFPCLSKSKPHERILELPLISTESLPAPGTS